MILVGVCLYGVSINIDNEPKAGKGKTDIFMQGLMAAQILAYAGIGQLQAAQEQKAEETDSFCKGFWNPAVQEGAEKKRSAETETANSVEGGDLAVGQVYLIGSISYACNQSVKAQCKNENQNMEKHNRIPFSLVYSERMFLVIVWILYYGRIQYGLEKLFRTSLGK